MPRASFHNYQSRCIYHITICKSPAMPPFSEIKGPLTAVCVERTLLGMIIEQNLRRISDLNPALRLLQYVIMPDHIHFLLFVTTGIERHVGKYIGEMKIHIGQAYRAVGGSEGPVFKAHFDDRILHHSRSLDTIYRYIRSNPYRLAVRRAYPDFFRRVYGVTIGGKRYQTYGNQFLLRNPFKEQVVVHRRDSEQTRARNRELWLHTAANGGVLVSPFISPAEKAIRKEAEESGGKIILITHLPFPNRYKPAEHDFSLCLAGRLLIIAPSTHPPPPTSPAPPAWR